MEKSVCISSVVTPGGPERGCGKPGSDIGRACPWGCGGKLDGLQQGGAERWGRRGRGEFRGQEGKCSLAPRFTLSQRRWEAGQGDGSRAFV